MEDADLLKLWESHDRRISETLRLNMKNSEDITKIKTRSFLVSMTPLKLFTVVTGIVWVIFVDTLIVNLYHFASPYFLISAAIQVVLTKLAIGIYLNQVILIQQVDVNKPVVSTQIKIAKLISSTLWIARILFLQLPVWTTFYLTNHMIKGGNMFFFLIQGIITTLFTYAAIWLFINIRYENRDKTWFRIIIGGQEWDPVMRAAGLLADLKRDGHGAE